MEGSASESPAVGHWSRRTLFQKVPWWNTADTEIQVPLAENSELTEAWSRHSIEREREREREWDQEKEGEGAVRERKGGRRDR